MSPHASESLEANLATLVITSARVATRAAHSMPLHRPRRVVPGLAPLVALILLNACGGEGGSKPASCVITAVSLAPSSGNIPAGDTIRVTPSITGTNCSSPTVSSWTSSNNAIATVSSAGTVTAVAEGGPVVITALAGGVSGTATFQVTPATIASITLTTANATIAEADTGAVVATVRDARGNTLTGRALTWSSSAPSVVSVDNTGRIIALAGGSSTITARDAGTTGVSGTVAITVTPGVVTSLTFTTPAPTIATDSAGVTVTVVAKNAAGKVLAGRAIRWTVNDVNVAIVPPSTWTACATEGGTCAFTGTKLVRYGTAQYFLAHQATGGRACTTAGFGTDPLPNVLKSCAVADFLETTDGRATVRAMGEGSATVTATLVANTAVTAQLGVNVPLDGGYATQFLGSSTARAGEDFYIVSQRYDRFGYNVTPSMSTQTQGSLIILDSGPQRTFVMTALGAGSQRVLFISGSRVGPTDSITINIAPPLIPVATVTPSIVNANVQVGQFSNVSALLKDGAGNTLTKRLVTWTSSDPSVATVGRRGPGFAVTGVSPGTATITATSEGKAGSLVVNVPVPPARIAYAMVNGNTLATVPAFTHNGMGGGITVTRPALGEFQVTFQGVAPTLGGQSDLVRVTPGDGAFCYIKSHANAGADKVVTVACQAPPYTVETPTNNATFSVLLVGNGVFPGRSSYFLANNPATAGPYAADPNWSYTSATAVSIQLSRTGLGVFTAATGLWPRPGGLTGTPEVHLVSGIFSLTTCTSSGNAVVTLEQTECFHALNQPDEHINAIYSSLVFSVGRAGTAWGFGEYSPNPLYDGTPYRRQSSGATVGFAATATGVAGTFTALPSTGARFLQVGVAGYYQFMVCGYGTLNVAAGTYEVICRDRTGAVKSSGFKILLGQ